MYCTVYSTSTSTVLSNVHCTVQYKSVSLFFARLNFIWGGRLKPPPSPNDAMLKRQSVSAVYNLIYTVKLRNKQKICEIYTYMQKCSKQCENMQKCEK